MGIGGSAFNGGVNFISDDYVARFVMDKDGSYRVTTAKRLKATGIRKHVRKIPLVKGLFSMFSGNRWMIVIIAVTVLSDLLSYNEKIGDSAASTPLFIVICLALIVFLAYAVKNMFYKIKDTWRYHGAEHKTIYACENNMELTLENVRKCPRVARRCGTNLVVFIAFFYAILAFLIELESVKLVVAYVLAYELFDLKNGDNIPVVKLFFRLGYWCQQHIFTLEPTDAQITAAIEAMNALMDLQKGPLTHTVSVT
ncbi:MAG: DUF1385 domain-containing protein [Clostridiales bacterium]|nr:DUF1385 domain-containing protein [Clostridiales bacterium]